MSTTLGSAFTPKPTVPPDQDEPADLALLVAVQELTEKVADLEIPAPRVTVPAPQVRVDVPPLPAVPTAAEIGRAVAAALPVEDHRPVLHALNGVKDAVTALAKKTNAPRFGGGGLATGLPNLMNAAPASDTGQDAIPVRIVSQLGAGTGGGGTGGLTNTELRATPVPVSGTVSVSNFPATQPVSIASTVPVSGTFWQATQPVSLATNTPDVTDRAARLLGHVTVDNASIPVTGTFFPATQPVSAVALPLPAGAAQDGTDISSPTAMPPGGAGIRGWLSAIWTKLNGSLAVTGTFWQTTQPVSGTFWQTTQPVVAAAMTDGTQVAQIRAATSYATVVSTAVSLGATLTLAAPGAGLFHYITSIEITNYTGIARTGGATPVTVTTTNLTGNPAYTFATAAAIGTTDRFIPIMCAPVKSAAANTATTIVCPVTTGSWWRINVTYYVAA